MTKILIDEAVVRQALEALEKKHGKWGQGHDDLNAAAITALRQALQQPAPAQPLPFGVGGGLVAIKTLLSRDPCAHAKVAIEMIDALLAEQPAPAQEPDPDELAIAYMSGLHAGKKAERKRIVNLLMIQHEATKEVHNYWKVAAQLIQAEVASDT